MDILRAALLKVFIKARPTRFDAFLWFVAIDQIDAWRDRGGAIGQRPDDVFSQVSWPGKYRLDEAARNFPFLNLRFSQEKETVGSGGQSAFDGKDVAQSQFAGIFDAGAARELCPLASVPKASS